MLQDASGREGKNAVQSRVVGGEADDTPGASSSTTDEPMIQIATHNSESTNDSSSPSEDSSLSSSSASLSGTEPETIVKTLHERTLVEMRDHFNFQKRPEEDDERNQSFNEASKTHSKPSDSTSRGSTSSSYKRYKFGLTNHFLTMPESLGQPKSVGVYQKEVLQASTQERSWQDRRKQRRHQQQIGSSHDRVRKSVARNLEQQQVDTNEHKHRELIDSDDNCDLSVLPPSSPDATSLLSHEADEEVGWPPHQQLTTEYNTETTTSNLNLTHSSDGGGPSSPTQKLLLIQSSSASKAGNSNLLATPNVLIKHNLQDAQMLNNNNQQQQSRVLPAGDAGLDASRCNSKASSANDGFPYLSASKFDGLESNSSKLHHLNHQSCPLNYDHDHKLHHHHHLKKKRKLNGEPDDCASNGLLVRFSSIIYATFLVILGCILHVSELKQKSRNSSDHIYTTIVASIGILWLIFLQSDLQRYKKYASKFILLESIFNDHKQQQEQQQHHHHHRGSKGDLNMLDPTSRSTTSSSASLVNDRMSMNTEVIFKKTAYKMYEQQAAAHHQHQQHQHKRQPYRVGSGSGSNRSSHHPYSMTAFRLSKVNGAQVLGAHHHHTGQDEDNAVPQLIPAYKFLHGKMGANFYLKCGMAAFCFGHVIHEGLRFGQQVYFFATSNANCRDSAALVAHLVTPLYSFYQLFMMFKYSNLVINRHKVLARFGLMHIIGTCVTFWFRTILEEAFEDFVHKMDYFKAQNKPVNHYLDPTSSFQRHHDRPSVIIVSDGERASSSQLSNWLQTLSALASTPNDSLMSGQGPGPGNLLAGGRNFTTSLQESPIQNNLTLAQSALIALMSSPISATITPQIVRHLPDSYHCAQNTLLTTKSMNALPYLYPFTIEYNLLIAATFLSLYFNIGKIGAAISSTSTRCTYSACCKLPSPLLIGTDSSSSASSRLYPNASPTAGYINTKQPIGSSSSSSYIGSHLDLTASDYNQSPVSLVNRYSHSHNQQKQHDLGEYKSNFVVNADCHAANKGLFLGFFVLLVTLVTIVIFFVTINKPSHLQLGIKINLIQEATLTSLILIVTLAGYRQIMRLNRNPFIKDKVTTDDVLMLIPLPFFFIHSLLSFRAETATLYSPHQLTRTILHHQKDTATPTLNAAETAARFLKLANDTNDEGSRSNSNSSSARGQRPDARSRQPRADFLLDLPSGLSAVRLTSDASNATNSRRGNTSTSQLNISLNQQQPGAKIDHYKLLTIVLNLAVMLEVLVQTNFIIDGLRRCSESRYLRFKKPGRELITFAILLNITYWIVATFETKSVEQYKTEIDYYGPLPYMFISHTTLPVMLFYRYHSSVCLAEIWNKAYKSPKRR